MTALAVIPQPTVDDLVPILEQAGITVVQHYDGWAKGEQEVRVVVFRKNDEYDKDTGFLAVDLAVEMNLPVAGLNEVWDFHKNEVSPLGPHWALYFLHAS